MKKMHIITPVKDSIDLTVETIRAVMSSDLEVQFTYTVYNDFSTPENTGLLEEACARYGCGLVHLSDLTRHPSPNYLLVLQRSQEEALREEAALCIVESDVVVRPDTIQSLFRAALEQDRCGMAAAVTVDAEGVINFPYLYAKGKEGRVLQTRKRLSFCCTLLTAPFLREYSFKELDPAKSWFDVTISHQSVKLGFRNYLLTTLPVFHRPHGSRPWKQLKYTDPLKYYWQKFIHKRDKI